MKALWSLGTPGASDPSKTVSHPTTTLNGSNAAMRTSHHGTLLEFVEGSLINLCGMFIRLRADKSRRRGEIKSRTVVRIYGLSDIYTSNLISLSFGEVGSVNGENVAVEGQLETECL
jgi:hypothetical protein